LLHFLIFWQSFCVGNLAVRVPCVAPLRNKRLLIHAWTLRLFFILSNKGRFGACRIQQS